MAINRALILFLHLGLSISSEANTPLCHLNMARCVCKATIVQNPLDLLTCLPASELEVRDGKLDYFSLDVTSSPQFTVNKVIFNNVTISSTFVTAFISELSKFQITEINILSSTIDAAPLSFPPPPLPASKIKILKLEEVNVNSSLLQPSFQDLHQWLFGSLTSLRLVQSDLLEFDCYWAKKAENLTDLDLSENFISPTSLQKISRCSSLSYKHLKSLHLRSSNLTSLQPLCTFLNLTTALAELDVSWNNFSSFYFPHCLEGKPLMMLNLSHSGVMEVNSFLSASLEELDLSYNSLEVIKDPPKTLKKLHVSHNRLIKLVFVSQLSHLKELNVDNNQLTTLIEDRDHLRVFEQLDDLSAGRNPYNCDCGLIDTVSFLNNTESVSEDLKTFLCATPESLQGTQITSFNKDCKKPISEAPTLSSPLCLALFIVFVSHLSDFC